MRSRTYAGPGRRAVPADPAAPPAFPSAIATAGTIVRPSSRYMAAPMLTMARIGSSPTLGDVSRQTPYRRCKPRVDPAIRVR